VLRAVLDANVYVSAALRPEGPPGQIIQRFLRDAAFEIVVSPAIMDEVLRALAYPRVRKHLARGFDVDSWFRDIAVLAQFVSGDYSAGQISDDPDDDKYITAAVEGLAGFVVSGDADLLSLKAYEGIHFISPRAFLARLSV